MEIYNDELKKLEIPAAYLSKFHIRRAGEARSTRDEQMEVFLHRINASRVNDGYPKYTYSRLAGMLKKAGYGSDDLYALAKVCDTYRSFGAGFHHQLSKPRV